MPAGLTFTGAREAGAGRTGVPVPPGANADPENTEGGRLPPLGPEPVSFLWVHPEHLAAAFFPLEIAFV